MILFITKRIENKELSRFKRVSSASYYMLFNGLTEIKLEKGTADYRLMSRQVAKAFSGFQEHELFIRGLIKWSGFRQLGIEKLTYSHPWEFVDISDPRLGIPGYAKRNTGDKMVSNFNKLISWMKKKELLFLYF